MWSKYICSNFPANFGFRICDFVRVLTHWSVITVETSKMYFEFYDSVLHTILLRTIYSKMRNPTSYFTCVPFPRCLVHWLEDACNISKCSIYLQIPSYKGKDFHAMKMELL